MIHLSNNSEGTDYGIRLYPVHTLPDEGIDNYPFTELRTTQTAANQSDFPVLWDRLESFSSAILPFMLFVRPEEISIGHMKKLARMSIDGVVIPGFSENLKSFLDTILIEYTLLSIASRFESDESDVSIEGEESLSSLHLVSREEGNPYIDSFGVAILSTILRKYTASHHLAWNELATVLIRVCPQQYQKYGMADILLANFKDIYFAFRDPTCSTTLIESQRRSLLHIMDSLAEEIGREEEFMRMSTKRLHEEVVNRILKAVRKLR